MTALRLLFLVTVPLLVTACGSTPIIIPPAGDGFPPTLMLCEQNVPGYGAIASHPWFAWSRDGHTWWVTELVGPGYSTWGTGERHGYAALESFSPDARGLTRESQSGRLRRQWEGELASRAMDHIESRWKCYPKHDEYAKLGPNSNTYIQWMINDLARAGIELPGASLSWKAWGAGSASNLAHGD